MTCRLLRATTCGLSKFRIRQEFDFAVASVGLMAAPKSSTITTATIRVAGVSTTPIEATGAEAALKGNTFSATVAANAGTAAAANAVLMTNNAYKTQIIKTIVKRAILT